jgi:hypothetical protein
MKDVLSPWKSSAFQKHKVLSGPAALLVVALNVFAPGGAVADEGGIPFWLSGQMGSLAATPQVPGWAIGIINYYGSVSASGNVAAAREITIDKLPATATVNLNLQLSGTTDVVLAVPTYVFATPVLGGQFAASLGEGVGRAAADLSGTLTTTIGGITSTRQGEISDARDGLSDLYPQASLRWNSGVNNWMVYGMGDIPIGTYDSTRLANLGIGHGAIDGGAGYTYFDAKAGHEFSMVTGLTYNFVNPSTGYQNGIDWHVDWAASQFVTKTVQVGLVGYFYQQLTADSGQAAILGENKSGVAGIGPQFGYLFPAGSMQGYLNLKSYWEFDADNRASGWNAWVTLVFSPKAPEAPESDRPIIGK